MIGKLARYRRYRDRLVSKVEEGEKEARALLERGYPVHVLARMHRPVEK